MYRITVPRGWVAGFVALSLARNPDTPIWYLQPRGESRPILAGTPSLPRLVARFQRSDRAESVEGWRETASASTAVARDGLSAVVRAAIPAIPTAPRLPIRASAAHVLLCSVILLLSCFRERIRVGGGWRGATLREEPVRLRTRSKP